MVPEIWHVYAVSCAGGTGCNFLFAIALFVTIWMCSLIKVAANPASSALFSSVDACRSRIYCGDFVGLRVVDPSTNRLRSISLFV
jgi:hypothetical protein